MGDPRGIGPEIICKSLSQYKGKYPIVIIGSMQYYPGKSVKLIEKLSQVNSPGVYLLDLEKLQNPKPPLSFAFVRQGVDWAISKGVAALVTAPIAKEEWIQAGIKYNGHTDYLVKRTAVKDHAMFFWSRDLKVILYTIHKPLKDVFSSIKRKPIVRYFRFIDRELSHMFARKFSFYICGLNPHAGEGGILGEEEKRVIIPAIESVRQELNISGPFPADTVFLKARNKEDGVVVCWYHDQGLIPFKLLHFHSGVNVTLGLPFIRTSPDHGTAFDIAGKGKANADSMRYAIGLAESLISCTSPSQRVEN